MTPQRFSRPQLRLRKLYNIGLGYLIYGLAAREVPHTVANGEAKTETCRITKVQGAGGSCDGVLLRRSRKRLGTLSYRPGKAQDIGGRQNTKRTSSQSTQAS